MSWYDLRRFKAACNYPGRLDEAAVDRHLQSYLEALHVERRVERLRKGWKLADHPSLAHGIDQVLDDWRSRKTGVLTGESSRAWALPQGFGGLWDEIDDAFAQSGLSNGQEHDARLSMRSALGALEAREKMDARVARAARNRRFAQDAASASAARTGFRKRALSNAAQAAQARSAFLLRAERQIGATPDLLGSLILCSPRPSTDERRRFDASCIYGLGRWDWDLSDMACSYLGARSLGRVEVEAWSKPLFKAFLAGAWLLYWSADTLFWAAKPVLHCDAQGRLHNERGPAIESDIEDLYFWRGVLVSEFVVMRPRQMTVESVDAEPDVEVRRVMIERYGDGGELSGPAAFMRAAGGKPLDYDESYGTLWWRAMKEDEPLLLLEVVNSTPEPDGRFKRYWLRVPPDVSSAREGAAWTFGFRAADYAPTVQT